MTHIRFIVSFYLSQYYTIIQTYIPTVTHFNNEFAKTTFKTKSSVKAFFHEKFFPIAELNKSPTEGFSAGLVDDSDIYKWQVVIMGPSDTPL